MVLRVCWKSVAATAALKAPTFVFLLCGIVVRFTKRLGIFERKKQFSIAFMRFDVVNDAGRCDPAIIGAHAAERISSKAALPYAQPSL